jgi:hypothetical protein
VVEGVNFGYCRNLTAVNALVLASLAWSPSAPKALKIGGAVQPHTTLAWQPASGPVVGYKIYWRSTTAPQWEHSRYVGNVLSHTLEGWVIDNHLFGVAAVGPDGHESPVAFPEGLIGR